MKRPATPYQTVPCRRPRLEDHEAPPTATVEDEPSPPTVVEDLPLVDPAGEPAGAPTAAPPGRHATDHGCE